MADAVDSGALKVVFDQIDGLLESASADEAQRAHNKQLLLKEFGAFFKMKVDTGAADVEDMWEPVETMSEESWRVSNGGQKVTMSASAGWRSIITRAPIGTPDQEQVFITIQPHALRILTVGLAVDRPEKYVGDSSSSYGYQSTGHMLCDGIAVTQQTSPSFEKGDTIGILLDQKYVNDSSFKPACSQKKKSDTTPRHPTPHPQAEVHCVLQEHADGRCSLHGRRRLQGFQAGH